MKGGKLVLSKKKNNGPVKKHKPFVLSPEVIKKCTDYFWSIKGIYIPYNVASSKNSKEFVYVRKKGSSVKSPRLVDSEVYAKYKRISLPYWRMQSENYKELVNGLKYPLKLYFYHIRSSYRRFDYHNAVQGPADIMQEIGWIPDDDSKYLKAIPGDFIVDKEHQGLVIFTEPINQLLLYIS